MLKGKEVLGVLQNRYARAAALASPFVISGICTVPAYAADEVLNSFDPTTALVSGFTAIANSVLATMTACLPVIMAVMSAFVCIKFGIRFFNRFVK